jgi:hypothetical protein
MTRLTLLLSLMYEPVSFTSSTITGPSTTPAIQTIRTLDYFISKSLDQKQEVECIFFGRFSPKTSQDRSASQDRMFEPSSWAIRDQALIEDPDMGERLEQTK